MSASLTTVLLTGASSGIGLAVAKRLAALPDRYRLIATARKESLAAMREEVRGPMVEHHVLDLLDETACHALMETIAQRHGGVDILINNAGISYRTVVEHLRQEDEQRQMVTNFFAPLLLMRLALPHMRQKRAGRIINVSSVGGMMAMPTMGIYSASKFALEGISESLWYEMRPWGVHVSLVQPGFVKSDSFRRVLLSDTAEQVMRDQSSYYNYYLHMGRFIERLMQRASTTPEKVAATLLRLMEQDSPPLRVPVGIDAHFFGILRRWLPRGAYHRLLYAFLPGIQRWGTGWREKPTASTEEAEEVTR
jgi:short-subunit dehydrogenase